MQMLMNLHATIVWLPGLFFLLFDREGRKFRVPGLTFLFAVLILLMSSGKAYYTY